METWNCLGWNIHDPLLCHFSPSMAQTSMTSVSWNCTLTQEFWNAVGSVVSKSCHVVMMSFVDHLLGAVCVISKLYNSSRYCYHCCCLLLLLQLLFTYWEKETTVKGKLNNLTMVSTVGNGRTELRMWMFYFKSSATFTHQKCSNTHSKAGKMRTQTWICQMRTINYHGRLWVTVLILWNQSVEGFCRIHYLNFKLSLVSCLRNDQSFQWNNTVQLLIISE